MKVYFFIFFFILCLVFISGIFYGYVSSYKVREYRKIYIPSCRYYYSAREQWGPGDYYDYRGRSCVEVIAEKLNRTSG